MSSSESSSEPVVVREDKPLLTFVAIISLIVGIFYIGRKYIGSIPALIVAYIIFVYRDDLKDEIGKVMPHDRT